MNAIDQTKLTPTATILCNEMQECAVSELIKLCDQLPALKGDNHFHSLFTTAMFCAYMNGIHLGMRMRDDVKANASTAMMSIAKQLKLQINE